MHRRNHTRILPPKTVLALATILAGLLVGSPARADHVCGDHLAAFGPVATFGFPDFYRDTTGLALELCLDEEPGTFCLPLPKPDAAAPLSFPDNFPDEAFYWAADASMTGAAGESFLLVLATEAAFINGGPVDGDQFAFGRYRFRMLGGVAGCDYTITFPYGSDIFTADATGTIDETEDIGLGPDGTGSSVQFEGPLTSRTGPWLVWDATPPAPPPGWIGDPAIDHAVTGSPCDQNFFRVESTCLTGGLIETDRFAVAGKMVVICGDGILGTGEACDDGNVNDGDCCSSVCTLEQPGAACDDGNACTDDACDPTSGACASTGNTEPCDDGDACTVNDTCDGAGSCAGGGAANCNDLNACTDDGCDPATGCANTANADLCDDADVCTTNEACSGGNCGGGTAISCDDDDMCTADTCDAVLGCINTDSSAACDDGNPCTDDSCDSITGCVNANNTAACFDGDFCTENDTCSAGACVGTPVVGCQELCGDVNGGGTVEIGDALAAAQFQVGLLRCDQIARFDLCDITPSGSCSIADALRMAQCTVGLIPCTFTCTLLTCQ
jgi:cysteine-rich repeat protein